MDAALDTAISTGSVDAARVLVDSHAAVTTARVREALDRGHLELAWVLIKAHSADDAESDALGGLPTDLAVRAASLPSGAAMVAYLIDVCGLDPSLTDTPALHRAAAASATATVDVLLDRGADPNLRDAQGLTAAHHAACNGRQDVLARLLGRIPNANTGAPETVLMSAARHGPSICSKVLSHHHDISCVYLFLVLFGWLFALFLVVGRCWSFIFWGG